MKNGVEEEWSYSDAGKIDGKTIYIMNDGSKIISGKRKNITRKYTAVKDEEGNNIEVELVKMDEECAEGLIKIDTEGVKIYYKIDLAQTQRVYCNPNTFAIFLGILAELGKDGIQYTGTGNVELYGTGYPSVSHVNGMSLDFSYKSGIQSNPQSAEVMSDKKLLDIGYLFSCRIMYVGKKHAKLGINQVGAEERSNHNDHIHLGPFDGVLNIATEIKEE